MGISATRWLVIIVSQLVKLTAIYFRRLKYRMGTPYSISFPLVSSDKLPGRPQVDVHTITDSPGPRVNMASRLTPSLTIRSHIPSHLLS